MSVPQSESQDPGSDREKWTQFYNELCAERDQLREELLKMREAYHDFYFGVLFGKFESPFTLTEVFDFASHRPSIQEIIDELQREDS
jgi:hypothetical protein